MRRRRALLIASLTAIAVVLLAALFALLQSPQPLV
jgi:hypothetical protein